MMYDLPFDDVHKRGKYSVSALHTDIVWSIPLYALFIEPDTSTKTPIIASVMTETNTEW